MKSEQAKVEISISGNIYKSNMREELKEFLAGEKLSCTLKSKEIATFIIKF